MNSRETNSRKEILLLSQPRPDNINTIILKDNHSPQTKPIPYISGCGRFLGYLHTSEVRAICGDDVGTHIVYCGKCKAKLNKLVDKRDKTADTSSSSIGSRISEKAWKIHRSKPNFSTHDVEGINILLGIAIEETLKAVEDEIDKISRYSCECGRKHKSLFDNKELKQRLREMK